MKWKYFLNEIALIRRILLLLVLLLPSSKFMFEVRLCCWRWRCCYCCCYWTIRLKWNSKHNPISLFMSNLIQCFSHRKMLLFFLSFYLSLLPSFVQKKMPQLYKNNKKMSIYTNTHKPKYNEKKQLIYFMVWVRVRVCVA